MFLVYVPLKMLYKRGSVLLFSIPLYYMNIRTLNSHNVTYASLMHTHARHTTCTQCHTHTQVCLRGGPAFDPDHPDMDPTHGPHSTDVVSSFIIKYFMNISTSPAIHESCLFTVSTCTPHLLHSCV